MKEHKYSLRYAAGGWWLLDIGQSGREYKAPLKLNAMGADIVRLLAEGKAKGEITTHLGERYEAENDAERQQIEADVEAFLLTLKEQGIEITGEKGTVTV